MVLNDLLMTMKHYEQIDVREMEPYTDEIGEKQYYFGSVWDLTCDDLEYKRISGREVKAVELGQVSLIIGI